MQTHDSDLFEKQDSFLARDPGLVRALHHKAVEDELSSVSSIAIIALLDNVLKEAHAARASDIHFDPRETHLRVRFRVDGMLEDIHVFPGSIHSEVISRVKVLAGLRTDEHFSTQDGRFRYEISEAKHIDVRVSIAPTYHGENAVLRLLSHQSDHTLSGLGFSARDQEKILSAIKRPSGMILATGPTGSGKTTTLYTLVKMLSSPSVSIVTIEDPIEFAVDNVEQMQVNHKTGLSFANGLRSILRQDPNIIMVGEIRDSETAGIAVNTALTGHLLLSTLHTSDAATTLPRLLDMGIDAYRVASTIALAIGQRLVRKICSHCREGYELTDEIIRALSSFPLSVPLRKGEIAYRGVGCAQCSQSGYSGRVAVNEVMVADDALRNAIMRLAPARELRALALGNGMTSMRDDGFQKVRAGLTSIDEILRAVHD